MTAREKIARLIQEKRLTQSAVADAAGVAYSTFRTYLDGNNARTPAADRAGRIANFLGVPSGWLFDDRADWPPPIEATPTSASDIELVDEIARRRQSVLRDLRTILDRLQANGVRETAEAAAARANAGEYYTGMTEAEKLNVRAVFHDFERIVVLVDRLMLLDPARGTTLEQLPPMREILKGFPNLGRFMASAHARENASTLDQWPSLLERPPATSGAPDVVKTRQTGAYTFERRFPIYDWSNVPDALKPGDVSGAGPEHSKTKNRGTAKREK